jgi:cephalosporin hydroxylase
MSGNIVIVDNSEIGDRNVSQLYNDTLNASLRWVRCHKNLGHGGQPIHEVASTPLLGWSMSWIIPAIMAYTDGCDFVYKEQDCLAFGDWLSEIRRGKFAVGRSQTMPCEQSLFFLRHDFILEFIRLYMAISEHDCVVVTEDKFRRIINDLQTDEVGFHDLPGGRDRPLPLKAPAWYAQRITAEDMVQICKVSVIGVQGWFDFANIYRRMVAEVRDGGTIIELGVWKGKSLCYLADCARRSGKNINIIGIDSFSHEQWDGYAAIQRIDRELGESRTVEQQCRDNLSRFDLNNVRLIQSDCIEAASLFDDGSVDFVFLDDNHVFDHVKRELQAWLPKMRRPTWIAGHDYNGETRQGVDSIMPNAVADGNSWTARLE